MKIDLFIECLPELPRQPCHSFVSNFIKALFVQISQQTLSFIKISGASEDYGPLSTNLKTISAAGSSLGGIQVGTGSTAVDIENHKLEAQIIHGSGAGQLQYGTTSHGSPSRTNNSMQITISRSFTNASGASITIREAGLVCEPGLFDWTLYAREVFSPITIPNGSSRTLTFTITISA